MQEYFIVGKVLKPQGVKGELKVQVLSDDSNRFDSLDSVFVKRGEQYKKLDILSADTRGEYSYITFQGIKDRSGAEGLRNIYLYVPREEAISLPEGRYFISDLEGCRVCTDAGEELGILEEIMQTGAADVYRVFGKRRLMFPAIKPLVLNVDIESKVIAISSSVLSEVVVYED